MIQKLETYPPSMKRVKFTVIVQCRALLIAARLLNLIRITLELLIISAERNSVVRWNVDRID